MHVPYPPRDARPADLLGLMARDVITGFEGRVVGHVRYMTGCNQALLQPPVKEDRSFADSVWIDEQRLEILAHGERLVLDNGTTPGCDRPAPKR